MLKVKNIGIVDPPKSLESGSRRTIDEPEGFGQWVFMLFTTDFVARVPGGTCAGAPGDILINSPAFPQWHEGISTPFHNYWFHFEGDNIDEILDRYSIPINVPVQIASPFRCLPTLLSMQHEFSFKDSFYEEALHELIHTVFRDVSRQLSMRSRRKLTDRDLLHLDLLHDLRIEMWRHPDRRWSVALIAERAGLSKSRLLHVYRRLFDRSPVDDLLSARVERAKSLLTGTHAPVSEIADRCGFSTIYYFSRVFKQRSGCTPSEYRTSTPV